MMLLRAIIASIGIWMGLMLAGMILPAQASYNDALQAFQKRDFKTAFKHAQIAAKNGDIRAQTMMGLFYTTGRGVKKDIKKAISWYQKAASKGHDGARFDLGMLYVTGKAGKKDYEKAKHHFKISSDNGNVRAQYNIGLIYANTAKKTKSEKDWKQSFFWYNKAAQRGFAAAQYSLGALYVQGRGVKKNLVTAAAWILKAAQKKLPVAEVDYAFMVLRGHGVQKNPKVAAQWLLAAAERGNVKAQFHIAKFLIAGRGIKKDQIESAKWYFLATGFGFKNKKFDSQIAKLGDAIKIEADKRATLWLLAAANKGHVVAQNQIAKRLYAGRGIKRDPIEAGKWHVLATGAGLLDKKFDSQLAQLNTAVKVEAQKRAAAWRQAFIQARQRRR